ncbi:hypothetical protein HanXRQr2_Chr09g0386331 [Helianthus annuus]|uniref:Uncharacterized protein n=1 Tax=Helianthus annuus TaxID=4232 RepID=A0A251TVK3_HELAN|nr:hypothetical protein HanXRQr2_Chr09g0386331 [Helianthus annuus]
MVVVVVVKGGEDEVGGVRGCIWLYSKLKVCSLQFWCCIICSFGCNLIHLHTHLFLAKHTHVERENGRNREAAWPSHLLRWRRHGGAVVESRRRYGGVMTELLRRPLI